MFTFDALLQSFISLSFTPISIFFFATEPVKSINYGPRNSNTNAYKNKGQMLNTTRDMLDKFFQPYNEQSAVLLQDDNFLWK